MVGILEHRKCAIMLSGVLLVSTFILAGSFGANGQPPSRVYVKLIDSKERPVFNIDIGINYPEVKDWGLAQWRRTNESGIAEYEIDGVRWKWGDYILMTSMYTDVVTFDGVKSPFPIKFTQPGQIITLRVNTRLVSLNVFDVVEGSKPLSFIYGLFAERDRHYDLWYSSINLKGRIEHSLPEVSFRSFLHSPLRRKVLVEFPEKVDVVRNITLKRAVNISVAAIDGGVEVKVTWKDVEFEDRGTLRDPVPYAVKLRLENKLGHMIIEKLGSFDILKDEGTKSWTYKVRKGWEDSVLTVEIYMDLSLHHWEWDKVQRVYQDPWVAPLAFIEWRETYQTPLLTTATSLEVIKVAQLESQMKELKGQLNSATSELDAAKKKMDDLQSRNSVLNSQLETGKAKVSTLEAENIKLKSQVDTEKSRADTLQSQLSATQAQLQNTTTLYLPIATGIPIVIAIVLAVLYAQKKSP